MAPTKSALPTEDVPIKMDPDLAAAVSGLLEQLSEEPRCEEGDDASVELPSLRALGREAVMGVYRSGCAGVFSELVDQYRKAIEEAAGFEYDPEEEEADAA